MVIGDYICVTLRGVAPWGFNLRQGDGDTYRPIVISQVDEGSCAFSAGVHEGDEVVSINGEPCADLTLLRAFALIDTSIDSLQLLLKRYCSDTPQDLESGGTFSDQRDSSDSALASTTLHILSSKPRSQSPRDLYISESWDEAYIEKLDSDADFPRGPHLVCTQLQAPLSDDQQCQETESPVEMLELQVSLSEQTLDDGGCTSLGSARGIEGEITNSKTDDGIPASSTSQGLPHSVREPLSQYGVVLSSVPRQVEVILQQPSASSEERGSLCVGVPRVSGSTESQSEGEEGRGGHCDRVPSSFTVSFEIPTEEETEVDQESDSEGDQDKPNRHHARHSRLRRSESLSEKQVKEAKSKCKRIAHLLTAAPPNPNNKGVLMFKKHRQRAKKYTLVSYGTGEDDSENSDEEDKENKDEETHTIAITLVAPKDSELENDLLSDSHCTKGLVTINWEKGLLEIERNLNNQTEMESLPETQGKGALMFAQRRQRMEEISAEHDELRRQGIPVEGVKQIENKIAEHPYMQSATEGHAYMDVNMHQQSQQQYQQYQEQQYYKQQESYKQQQSYHQQQQSYQQQQQQQQYEQQYQQYEQQQYQQQMYHQQQGYHQEQQQYAANINGNIQHQSTEMQSSFTNRTAKPFSVENAVATPYTPVVSGTNQDSASQGEQIASRDERIATPAIKTGLLQDARRRTTGKPMFTFKEAPKVSPSPVLLNLLNRKDRKLGFETGAEEDYLSLGAEACNFLQTPHVKQKIPPPVAPKPVVNPNSLLWPPQIEMNNQDTAQHAENSISTPAAAPTIDATPAPQVEPTPAPAPESSAPPELQEVPASITAQEEQQQTWVLPEQEPKQQSVPVENGHLNPTQQPEPAMVSTWTPSEPQLQQPATTQWHQSALQSQEIPSSDSPSQPSWIAQPTSHAQVQPHPPSTTWTPQSQPHWSQPEEHAHVQAQAHQPWSQPAEQALVQPPRSQPMDQPQPHPQPQAQPPWAQSREQPHLQQMQPSWGQPQEPVQQQAQAPWAQPQRTESPQQPPWMQTPQQKPEVQPPWVREAQPEYQSQPAWVQPPQQQPPQQAWPQDKAPGQPQPPWDLAQAQQPSVNAWNPSPAQSQPAWMHPSQAPPQVQANLNPWAPVPAQAESQPSWTRQPPEHGQQIMQSWAQEPNQTPNQPWAQPGPAQPVPQPHWQTPLSRSETQPQMNTGWPAAQSQPQAPVKVWSPEPKQTTATVSSLTVNPRPSPKPWQAMQNTTESRIPPPPPQRMHSFTIGPRHSSPINPMATTLNPSSAGPAYEMPVVKGKGADMFAKRQSRMEKYVVDSETVQANKESRSASPAASLPNEWKYTPNVRAPPSRAFNPIQAPFYPPAALKQPTLSTPTTKDKKKANKPTAPAKQLNVIDVMKHQPYQLSSSLFTYGPAEESPKPPAPKPENLPSNQPIENQQISYEQMAPMQQTGQFNSSYPPEGYGMPMQPMMHDSHYQQNPVNIYAPPNAYQQPAVGLYQQPYNQQYQQAAPPAYHAQSPQSPNPPYPQSPQASYQPASSPPYLAAPSVPYQQQQQPQPPNSYIAPSFSVAARPESASGSNPVSAPKPKFTAKKSSAQVWKPGPVDKE